MKTSLSVFIIVFMAFAFFQCSEERVEEIKLSAPTIDMVRITGGPWHHAMELEREYLRSLDTERLLFHFKKTAGIETNSKEYGGWEMEWRELRGHSIGHYLSAISRMGRLTNDSVLLARCNYTVQELNRCQKQIGTGYLSAWPEEYLDRVENLEEVWAPYYTIHKILAGLLDSYIYCDDQLALSTALDFVHYLHSRITPLGKEYFQKVLDKTEQGGLPETLWNLYAVTGDTVSSDLAQYFYQKTYFDPLEQGKENLKGWHSNSFIPAVVGVAREFELTGDITKKRVSELFWKQVIEGRSFVTGGTSNGEHWNAEPYHMHSELGPGAHESCCSYNLIKLSNHLWNWSKDVKYQEYMERTLVNAILSTQNPVTGMSMYYTSTAPGYYKTWGTPDSAFWCCTGTGMENFSRTAEYIYALQDNRIYVNQFVPSELNYEEKGFKLIQETTLPDGKNLNIKVLCEKPVNLKLAIRIPSWTGDDYEVNLNGKSFDAKPAPGAYLLLDRVWHNNDNIDISFTPHLWYSLLPLTNSNVAFGFGPVVLAAIHKGEKVEEKLRHRYGPYDGTPVDVPPILFNANNFSKYIEVVNEEDLLFKVKSQSGDEIKLMPFYNIVNEHFSIYLPIDSIENNINIKEVDPSDHI